MKNIQAFSLIMTWFLMSCTDEYDMEFGSQPDPRNPGLAKKTFVLNATEKKLKGTWRLKEMVTPDTILANEEDNSRKTLWFFDEGYKSLPECSENADIYKSIRNLERYGGDVHYFAPDSSTLMLVYTPIYYMPSDSTADTISLRIMKLEPKELVLRDSPGKQEWTFVR